MQKTEQVTDFQAILDAAVQKARSNEEGKVAQYIPELASADPRNHGYCH